MKFLRTLTEVDDAELEEEESDEKADKREGREPLLNRVCARGEQMTNGKKVSDVSQHIISGAALPELHLPILCRALKKRVNSAPKNESCFSSPESRRSYVLSPNVIKALTTLAPELVLPVQGPGPEMRKLTVAQRGNIEAYMVDQMARNEPPTFKALVKEVEKHFPGLDKVDIASYASHLFPGSVSIIPPHALTRLRDSDLLVTCLWVLGRGLPG